MIGTSELLVILLIILLLFGGKRLPELARSLGLAVAEFRKASEKITDEPGKTKTGEGKKRKPAG